MTIAGAATGALVLVADDVEANVELLRDQLTALGYRVIDAADGPSALARAIAEAPDLCLLDVSMPAGDLGVDPRDTGYEVCRRLKQDPRTVRIPVIFVTAQNDPSARVKAIEAGGDDFLLKPHDRHVLGARVRSLLQLKRATDALAESLERLQGEQRTREDLVRMVVHDLKTPLTAILATLEMLRDGDYGAIDERPRRALSDVEGQAEDLLGLIQDLLDVSKVEEQSLLLQPEPIAPAALFAELCFDWAARFQQAQTTTRIEVAEDAPVFAADKTLLKRVLSNLVQNAITHAPVPVTLILQARREGEGIQLSVQDDGPGSPKRTASGSSRSSRSFARPERRRCGAQGSGSRFVGWRWSPMGGVSGSRAR